MNPRRKPIFARTRRGSAQPHWVWVAVSLATLVAVTLFDFSPTHHSWATTTPEQLAPAQSQSEPAPQLQASN